MRFKLLVTNLAVLLTIYCSAQSTASVYVHFAFNRAELNRTAKATLDSLTDFLDVSDKIELHGHCDAIGSGTYNDRLSQKRVNMVKDYLLDIGWEKKEIIVAAGHGENMPLNENNSAEERSLNRRVEIKILYGQPAKEPSLLKKLADTTTKVNTSIVLRNINFIGGMHRFLPESAPMLVELLAAMQAYPTLVIRVEGHICCQPGTQDGQDIETGLHNLSEARAKAVMDYLIVNGIDANRVTYKGFGHSMPIYPAPENNDEERKINRRVEIKIIRK